MRHSGIIGLCIITTISLLALLAPYVTPYKFDEMNLDKTFLKPCREHIFGTDNFGRDVFTRVVYGGRYSLFISIVTIVLTVSLGVFFGLISGYYGGVIDEVIMRVVDILLAFPSIILAIAIVGILGPSFTNIIIALSAVWWVKYARLVRGMVLSIKEREFIEATRALRVSNTYIIFNHVFPNVISPIIALATLDIGHAIISIASLGFLGLGAQPPIPEWGTMLKESLPFMQTSPHLMIFPGSMIALAVLGFNLLGDYLRDLLDPRVKENEFVGD